MDWKVYWKHECWCNGGVWVGVDEDDCILIGMMWFYGCDEWSWMLYDSYLYENENKFEYLFIFLILMLYVMIYYNVKYYERNILYS